jgi:Amt family ammonium transporter
MFDSLPGSAKRAAAALLPALLLAWPVLAADAAPVPDKGDTAWMMVST